MGCFFVSTNRTKIDLLEQHANLLRCPICLTPMKVREGRSLVCASQHCFDIARQGYVNWLSSVPKSKYNRSLFESRRIICKTGFFDPVTVKISERIAARWSDSRAIRILDAGCGEGSPLASIVDTVFRRTGHKPLGVGVDLSKEGIVIAARDYREAIWCVADLARCPFGDQSFSCIVNMLSPSNYGEFQRMLTDDGMLIKVIPGEEYLKELRDAFSQPAEREAGASDRTLDRFRQQFALLDSEQVQYRVPIGSDLLPSLLQMTPLSWGATEEQMKQVIQAGIRHITVDLMIVYGSKPSVDPKSNVW